MADSLPLHRFREFGDLSADEEAAIAALGDTPRRIERYRTIRAEGATTSGFYLLLEGWALASVTLPDGGRQILKVHLPGDALGTPSMSVQTAAEALTTVTPVVVSAVSYERFGGFLQAQPRLAAKFLLSVQRERIALMDQLASVGRTTAESRLAAFLIDLLERLEPMGVVEDDGYQLMLTQEQIGDTLGLTGVHVNRTMRELEDRGLVSRNRQRVFVLDRAELGRLAARPARKLRTDLFWLPKR